MRTHYIIEETISGGDRLCKAVVFANIFLPVDF